MSARASSSGFVVPYHFSISLTFGFAFEYAGTLSYRVFFTFGSLKVKKIEYTHFPVWWQIMDDLQISINHFICL